MEDAKNKANELIKYFSMYVDAEIVGDYGFEFSKDEEIKNAKMCALIAVDEILKNIDATMYYNPESKSIPINRKFWEEVKSFLI